MTGLTAGAAAGPAAAAPDGPAAAAPDGPAGAASDGPDGLIFDIQRFSIHDGPGIRTVLFLKGCPLRCAWCANPESQLQHPEVAEFPARCLACAECVAVCPRRAVADAAPFDIGRERCDDCGRCAEVCAAEAKRLVGRTISVREAVEELTKDFYFYRSSGGGVTLSGGEPLAQAGFSGAVLRACRRAGIPTALETCGHGPFDELAGLCSHADVIFYDVKMLDHAAHRRLTGVSNALILANLRRLGERGIEVTVRTPLVPGCNDAPEQVRELARFCAGLPHVRALELLPYHSLGAHKFASLGRSYPLRGLAPPDDATVARLHAAAVAGLAAQGLRPGGRAGLPCRVVAAFA